MFQIRCSLLLLVFLLLSLYSWTVSSQICLVRFIVSVPDANGTIFNVEDASNNILYGLQDLDVTPYSQIPCVKETYAFFSEKTQLSSITLSAVPGSIYSVVLSGLLQGNENPVSAQFYQDDWNATSGESLVRVINLAPETDYLSIEANGTQFEPTIQFQQTTTYSSFPSNKQYAFFISEVSSTKVVLDEYLFLNDETSYTFWIQGQAEDLQITMTQDYPPDVPLIL